MKTQNSSDELKKMAALAASVFQDFDKLYNFMREKKPSIFIAKHESQKLVDAFDMICSIMHELRAQTDGRPATIYIDGEEVARCDDPGYREIATVGGYELTAEKLEKIRDWIPQVLEWHKQHPNRYPRI